MAKVKELRFEVDGAEHVVVPRRMRRGLMNLLATVADPAPVEVILEDGAIQLEGTEDWGVERLARSIDGECPTCADEEVQDYAFTACMNYFLPIVAKVKQI